MRIATALIILVGAIGFVVGHTMFTASAVPPLPYPECRGDLDNTNNVNFPGDVILLSKVTNGLATLTIGNGQCVPLTPIPTWTQTPTRTPTSTPTATPTATDTPVVQLRDKYVQPFAQDSIWNMPVGSGATLAAANLTIDGTTDLRADYNVIILKPTETPHDIVFSSAEWSGASRCTGSGVQVTLPMPASFLIPDVSPPELPNSAAAILKADDHTIAQNQPLAHCSTGGQWTSSDFKGDVDIYGPGITGAHGGSGLSSLGGTIRLGELTGAISEIPHALQIEVNCDLECSNNSPGYRWPATQADSCWASCYTGGNAQLQPGSLLVLQQSFNVSALETVPGQILARTMRDYGAYVVDSTSYQHRVAFTTEFSPDGDVQAQFFSTWGTNFAQGGGLSGTGWARDVKNILQHLYVVTNNDATHIGGGGAPVVPTAAPIGN